MKQKKWILAAEDPSRAEQLAGELRLDRLPSRVLAARGICTRAQAVEFLDSSPARIHDPFLLRDMDKAVACIRQAIADRIRIAVYGDYDVDGVTATCILIQYLKKQGADCTYYIPDRLGEGYGLNEAAIQSLYDEGCRLLITVDSGITAVEEAAFAASIGLRLIITDHHECKETLPAAEAVVNPRRTDSDYPFRELAGVGVAFKLVCALEAPRGIDELLDEYSDVVAVGTIADVMPLVGENRVIVTHGLRHLQNTRNYGLRALMQKLGLDQKPLSANSVSFIMAPRINAAGRLGGASSAARMFLTDDPQEAAELAEHLCDLNRQRQEEENGIYEQITARLKEEPELTRGRSLVLWDDNWHNGVIGIVSSRLSDRYGVPCILISMSGDSGKGSGRSIKGFNLYAALEKNADLLEKYGGHELAVGLTIRRDRLMDLRRGLENYAAAAQTEEIVPCINVDCAVTPEDLTLRDVRSLSVLEPFGMGNPQPTFLMKDVRVEEITPISHDRHVKLHLMKDGKLFYGFVFGMGARSCLFVRGDLLDLVFAAEINTYRGADNVQLVVKDVRWSESEQEADRESLAVYRRWKTGGTLSREEALLLSPSREDLVAVFRHIRTNAEDGLLCGDARTLYRRVRYEARTQLNLGRFLVCLDVFSEFAIFSYTLSGPEISIRLNQCSGKADINGSGIIHGLLEIAKG